MTFKIHPAAAIWPLMNGTEMDDLAHDIADQGQQQPIKLSHDGSTLIDGRNRLRACEIAGVHPVTERLPEMTEMETLNYIASANRFRRHLTPNQQVVAAVEMEPMYAEAAKERQRQAGKQFGRGQEEKLRLNSGEAFESERTAAGQAAAANGVSRDSVNKGKALKKDAPDLYEKMRNEEMTLNAATKERKKRQGPPMNIATKEHKKRQEPSTEVESGESPAPSQDAPTRRGKIDSQPVIDALNTWIDRGNSGRDGLVEFVKQQANVKLSHGQLETKLRELHAVRNADLEIVDWDSIPGNQREKLERTKASIRRQLEKEFDTRLLAALDQHRAKLDADFAAHKAKLDAENQRQRAGRDEERARYKEGIAVYAARGLITPGEYRTILACLHPDTATNTDGERAVTVERLKKAFRLFDDSKIKTLLVKEV